MCKRVFSVGFGPGLDSMSPPQGAGDPHHGWLPQKTGCPGLRRGSIRWIQFAQSILTVAHHPRAGCIRLVPATRLDQLVYSPNYYIQIFRLNLLPVVRIEPSTARSKLSPTRSSIALWELYAGLVEETPGRAALK